MMVKRLPPITVKKAWRTKLEKAEEEGKEDYQTLWAILEKAHAQASEPPEYKRPTKSATEPQLTKNRLTFPEMQKRIAEGRPIYLMPDPPAGPFARDNPTREQAHALTVAVEAADWEDLERRLFPDLAGIDFRSQAEGFGTYRTAMHSTGGSDLPTSAGPFFRFGEKDTAAVKAQVLGIHPGRLMMMDSKKEALIKRKLLDSVYAGFKDTVKGMGKPESTTRSFEKMLKDDDISLRDVLRKQLTTQGAYLDKTTVTINTWGKLNHIYHYIREWNRPYMLTILPHLNSKTMGPTLPKLLNSLMPSPDNIMDGGTLMVIVDEYGEEDDEAWWTRAWRLMRGESGTFTTADLIDVQNRSSMRLVTQFKQNRNKTAKAVSKAAVAAFANAGNHPDYGITFQNGDDSETEIKRAIKDAFNNRTAVQSQVDPIVWGNHLDQADKHKILTTMQKLGQAHKIAKGFWLVPLHNSGFTRPPRGWTRKWMIPTMQVLDEYWGLMGEVSIIDMLYMVASRAHNLFEYDLSNAEVLLLLNMMMGDPVPESKEKEDEEEEPDDDDDETGLMPLEEAYSILTEDTVIANPRSNPPTGGSKVNVWVVIHQGGALDVKEFRGVYGSEEEAQHSFRREVLNSQVRVRFEHNHHILRKEITIPPASNPQSFIRNMPFKGVENVWVVTLPYYSESGGYLDDPLFKGVFGSAESAHSYAEKFGDNWDVTPHVLDKKLYTNPPPRSILPWDSATGLHVKLKPPYERHELAAIATKLSKQLEVADKDKVEEEKKKAAKALKYQDLADKIDAKDLKDWSDDDLKAGILLITGKTNIRDANFKNWAKQISKKEKTEHTKMRRRAATKLKAWRAKRTKANPPLEDEYNKQLRQDPNLPKASEWKGIGLTASTFEEELKSMLIDFIFPAEAARPSGTAYPLTGTAPARPAFSNLLVTDLLDLMNHWDVKNGKVLYDDFHEKFPGIKLNEAIFPPDWEPWIKKNAKFVTRKGGLRKAWNDTLTDRPNPPVPSPCAVCGEDHIGRQRGSAICEACAAKANPTRMRIFCKRCGAEQPEAKGLNVPDCVCGAGGKGNWTAQIERIPTKDNPTPKILPMYVGEPKNAKKLGLVTAEVQVARNIFVDMGELVQDIYRGLIGGRQSMSEKRMAMSVAVMEVELSSRAEALGGNAVGNIKFDFELPPAQGKVLNLIAMADALKVPKPRKPKKNSPVEIAALTTEASNKLLREMEAWCKEHLDPAIKKAMARGAPGADYDLSVQAITGGLGHSGLPLADEAIKASPWMVRTKPDSQGFRHFKDLGNRYGAHLGMSVGRAWDHALSKKRAPGTPGYGRIIYVTPTIDPIVKWKREEGKRQSGVVDWVISFTAPTMYDPATTRKGGKKRGRGRRRQSKATSVEPTKKPKLAAETWEEPKKNPIVHIDRDIIADLPPRDPRSQVRVLGSSPAKHTCPHRETPRHKACGGDVIKMKSGKLWKCKKCGAKYRLG
jgi:uncharacterized protein YbjQ (UPF0145 family)